MTVPTSRLDDVLSGPIDILKLDLQGYELEALRGAGNLLSQTRVVLTEVGFLPIYEQAPTFCDIHEFLKPREFEIHELYVHYMFWGPQGRLEWGDALYLNHAFDDWPPGFEEGRPYDVLGKHYSFDTCSYAGHSYAKPTYQ